MWYTVLHANVPVGVVQLSATPLAVGRMLRFPGYDALGATTRAATAALLHVGLYGGALPARPPYVGELLRLRHAINRAARLELSLVDAHGGLADAAFVNLLEAPADAGVVVVAGFCLAGGLVAAIRRAPPGESTGSG